MPSLIKLEKGILCGCVNTNRTTSIKVEVFWVILVGWSISWEIPQFFVNISFNSLEWLSSLCLGRKFALRSPISIIFLLSVAAKLILSSNSTLKLLLRCWDPTGGRYSEPNKIFLDFLINISSHTPYTLMKWHESILTVFNLSIEKIMPWDPCSYLIHYINWLRFQLG